MRPLHDVTSEAKTRQKQTKKRTHTWMLVLERRRKPKPSLWVINEHFESVFNKVLESAVVVKGLIPC
jgi:hypothetical protein